MAPKFSKLQGGLVALAAAGAALFALGQAVACNVPGAERFCAIATQGAQVSQDVGEAVEQVEVE